MDPVSLRNPTNLLEWAADTIRRFQASLNPTVDFARKRHPTDPSDIMSRRVSSTLPRSFSDPMQLHRKSSVSRGHMTGYLLQPLPPVKEMECHSEECEMVALKPK
ncbi:hypothetical protein BSKO_01533 [Bryopsis sp. KO-2023]|nr:hypothetical protein BSKO_01533 [Bryopsis sp. KO-2023]